ncbi:MAG: DM13 domain-containing protein [Pseudomonadota bacterium]
MKRFLTVIIPVFLVGFVAGNAFWYLASPLWIDVEVNETLAGADTLTTVATGNFRDADRAHSGTGVATILARPDGSAVLRLTEFEVTNGPDLEVWLSASPDPQRSSDVADNAWLALGQLKGNIGDQNYDIPAGTDLSAYRSVVIWCEQFGVLFSPAALAMN